MSATCRFVLTVFLLVGGCAPRTVFSPPAPDVPAEAAAAHWMSETPPDSSARGYALLLHGGRADEAARVFRAALESERSAWQPRLGLALALELLARPIEAAFEWAHLSATAPPCVRETAARVLIERLRPLESRPPRPVTGDDGRASSHLSRKTLARAAPQLRAALADLARRRPAPDCPRLAAELAVVARGVSSGDGGRLGGTAIGEWSLASPSAPLPALSFMRPDEVARRPLSGSLTADHEGWLRLPDNSRGLFVAETETSLALAREVVLVLESDLPVRLSRNGRVILERDSLTAFPPRQVAAKVLLPAGQNRLRLEMAGLWPGGRARVSLLAADDTEPASIEWVAARGESPETDGAPRLEESPSGPRCGESVPPILRDLLAAERALTEQAPRRAYAPLAAARRDFPRAAVLHWLAARQWAADPSIPRHLAARREMEALRQALSSDPSATVARARLARRLYEERRPDEALAEALAGEAAAPHSPFWDRLRAMVAADQGWRPEAREMTKAALEHSPLDCDLWVSHVELDWERLRLAPWRPDPELRARCPALERLFARHLRESGRAREAAEVLEALAEGPGGRESDYLAAAAARLASGDYEAAFDDLERIAGDRPASPAQSLRLIEAARLAGRHGAAERELERLMAHPPGERDLRRRITYLEEDPHWSPFAVDGVSWAVGARPRAAALGVDASAVVLLDQQISRFFEDGSGLNRVHVMIEIRTARGAERFGEVVLQSEAEVILARTLKPDGSIVEPDERFEVGALSMPGLEPGDVIEAVILHPILPSALLYPHLLADGFFFESYQVPILRSEWTVITPASMPLLVSARGLLTDPEEQELNRPGEPLLARTWRRFNAPRQASEAHIPDARAALSHASVSTIGWREFGERIADHLLTLLPLGAGTGELPAHARAGWPEIRARGMEERARAAFRLVRDRIEQSDSDLLEISAAETLATGRGDRTVLLLALLKKLEVPVELVLLKPIHRTIPDTEVPDLLAYTYPVLRLSLPERELWLDPALDDAEFDYLPPVLQDRPGLSLGLHSAGEFVASPRYPSARERRSVVVRAVLSDDGGTLEGRGEDTFRGIQAMTLRGLLAHAEDEARERLVRTMAQSVFPSAEIEEYTIDTDDPARAVVVRYLFRAPVTQPPPRGGVQRLRLRLLPEDYTATWARRPWRRHPLFLNLALDQHLDLTLRLPPGVQFIKAPRESVLETPFGVHRTSAETSTDFSGRQSLHLEKRLRMPPAIVPPEAYGGFAATCRSFDNADEAWVSLRWPGER